MVEEHASAQRAEKGVPTSHSDSAFFTTAPTSAAEQLAPTEFSTKKSECTPPAAGPEQSSRTRAAGSEQQNHRKKAAAARGAYAHVHAIMYASTYVYIPGRTHTSGSVVFEPPRGKAGKDKKAAHTKKKKALLDYCESNTCANISAVLRHFGAGRLPCCMDFDFTCSCHGRKDQSTIQRNCRTRVRFPLIYDFRLENFLYGGVSAWFAPEPFRLSLFHKQPNVRLGFGFIQPLVCSI